MSCMICDIEYVCMECEQLQKGLKMNSDLLDEYCEQEYGHTHWAMSWDDEGNMVVTFFKDREIEDVSS